MKTLDTKDTVGLSQTRQPYIIQHGDDDDDRLLLDVAV